MKWKREKGREEDKGEPDEEAEDPDENLVDIGSTKAPRELVMRILEEFLNDERGEDNGISEMTNEDSDLVRYLAKLINAQLEQYSVADNDIRVKWKLTKDPKGGGEVHCILPFELEPGFEERKAAAMQSGPFRRCS